MSSSQLVRLNSVLASGREQIFVKVLLKVPHEVWKVMTHMMPSGPGWTSVMIAMGPCAGAVLSFSSMTTPACGLGDDLCYR
jgi:hypothetical protein